MYSTAAGAGSEEADCISEERGMYYHTQMHNYSTRKGTDGCPLQNQYSLMLNICNIVGGEARRRYSQYRRV